MTFQHFVSGLDPDPRLFRIAPDCSYPLMAFNTSFWWQSCKQECQVVDFHPRQLSAPFFIDDFLAQQAGRDLPELNSQQGLVELYQSQCLIADLV